MTGEFLRTDLGCFADVPRLHVYRLATCHVSHLAAVQGLVLEALSSVDGGPGLLGAVGGGRGQLGLGRHHRRRHLRRLLGLRQRGRRLLFG